MVNPIELEIFYQEICTKALVLVKSDLLVKKNTHAFYQTESCQKTQYYLFCLFTYGDNLIATRCGFFSNEFCRLPNSAQCQCFFSILQSMTCDVRPQLTEVRCAVATCNVRAEPILVVTCDVRACSAFSGLQSATAIWHIFCNNERTDKINQLSFCICYDFVAQKWRI